MSFYIIYLFIIFAIKAISVESHYESLFLYKKFCDNLDVADTYRHNKEWLKLREYNKKQPTEDKNGDFAEWSYLYYSIERFFHYCDFLIKGEVCEFSIELMQKKRPFVCKCARICAPYEDTKFQHIALKPEFKYESGDTMPIGDAMRKIVDAYQKLYPGNLQKLQSLLIKQNELPKMDFCNKDDCIKVDAWVYYAKQGVSEKTAATPKLEEIQMHLLENVNKPLNLKEFPPQPPQPPQNKQQTSDKKPKTKQSQNYSTSSSSSPGGHYHPNTYTLLDIWRYSLLINAMDDNRNSACYSGTSGAGNDGCCFAGCDGGGCDGCDGGGCDGGGCDIGGLDCVTGPRKVKLSPKAFDRPTSTARGLILLFTSRCYC